MSAIKPTVAQPKNKTPKAGNTSPQPVSVPQSLNDFSKILKTKDGQFGIDYQGSFIPGPDKFADLNRDTYIQNPQPLNLENGITACTGTQRANNKRVVLELSKDNPNYVCKRSSTTSPGEDITQALLDAPQGSQLLRFGNDTESIAGKEEFSSVRYRSKSTETYTPTYTTNGWESRTGSRTFGGSLTNLLQTPSGVKVKLDITTE